MSGVSLPDDKSLLLVDDDKPFVTRLARAMETRGFDVRVAESVAEGVAMVRRAAPAFAVVDLRLGDGNGLDVIEALHATRPEARAVVLTPAHQWPPTPNVRRTSSTMRTMSARPAASSISPRASPARP